MSQDDPCCAVCDGRGGICLSRHGCHHHKQAQKQLDADDRARQTHRDPTARQAINNVSRAQNPRRRR